MTIKSELLALQDEEGILDPKGVVDWARKHKKSALHGAFTWDDAKAADEYRIWEARRLIRIHIVTDDGEPEFVSLSIDRPGGGGYRSVSDVLSNRNLSDVMLRDALSDLERVRARYARVKELTSVWNEVDKAKRVAKEKQAARSVAPAA